MRHHGPTLPMDSPQRSIATVRSCSTSPSCVNQALRSSSAISTWLGKLRRVDVGEPRRRLSAGSATTIGGHDDAGTGISRLEPIGVPKSTVTMSPKFTRRNRCRG